MFSANLILKEIILFFVLNHIVCFIFPMNIQQFLSYYTYYPDKETSEFLRMKRFTFLYLLGYFIGMRIQIKYTESED